MKKAIDSRYKNVGRKKNDAKTYGLKVTKNIKVEWWDFWTNKDRTEIKKRNRRLKR